MKFILKIFLVTSVFLSANLILFSQHNLKVEHISLEQGVSNNLIYSITQDSKGFIWFGTMFGLVRYDGNEYKTYRYDPLDSNSLSNDDVISIFEDKDGMLWIGTYNGGLNKYDRKTGIFTRYLHNPSVPHSMSSNLVWKIFQDRNGVIWFGTEEGLNKFENGKFTAYKPNNSSEGNNNKNAVRSIAEDEEGNLWIGTIGNGLNIFDREKETFLAYKYDSLNHKSINGNSITSIIPDDNGIIWISTGRGLNKFDRSKNEFQRFKQDSINPSGFNNYIFLLEKEGKDHLLLGTQNGLSRFDKSTGNFEQIKIYPERKKQGSILAFTKDRSGVIWASAYQDGLHKIYEKQVRFKNYLPGNNVKAVFVSRSGLIYAGTTNGLEVIDKSGMNIITYLPEKQNSNSLSNNEINSITEDDEGNLWIGTNNGLNKLDPVTKKFSSFFNDPGKKNSLSSSNILKVYYDKSGVLWVGTGNGLNMKIKNSEDFIHYKNIEIDSNSLSENTILSIYEDTRGDLWTGTYKGLNRFDKNTGKFRRYQQNPNDPKTISSNYVFSFCEDKSGNFWIGTGGGLNIFDRKTETFFHFNQSEGLPNSVIAGIEEDNDGYLWISTFKGISKFDITNRTFRNYDADDGLQSNMFNTGSYYKTSDGKILFGGINGYDAFDPFEMKDNSFTAPVILTSLTKYDGKNKTEFDISSLTEIELGYNENVINLKFSSLDYTNPTKNKFAYMLDGFDKDWIAIGNENEAIYTNLDPGNYTFKVKAANSDGVWNEQPASINIKINPPFWKTWWFYSLILIALAGTLFAIQNYRVRRKVKDLIQLEKIKEKEREFMREQASRDYHDELGHKLTRISMYSRRINKKLRPTANGLTQDLNSIIETSNSLQSGAKDLIWAMNPQEDSLYDFAVRLRDFGNDLFENTGIAFHTVGINDELKNISLSMNSKRHLIYIFKEGMNNILKYAGCKNVNLKFSIYLDDLEIFLEDDGVGFDINNCAKGYGLKNIFSRAEQININVNIDTEETAGTKIRLKTNISNLVTA